MKKVILLIFIIIMMINFSSCNVAEGNISDRIAAPENKTPPILGKWEIEEVLKRSYTNLSSEKVESLIGREAMFHKDGVVMVDEFTVEPTFKIRNVKSSDYLIYKYKTNPKVLGIEDSMVEVITILSDGQYFAELIKIDNSKMLINIDDNFYSMIKVVDEVSIEEIQRYISVEKTLLMNLGDSQEEKYQSGVLIGLKMPSFDVINQVQEWEYKTIWINSHDKNIMEIYELDRLLVPRKNGFWILESNREIVGDQIKDDIVATPLFRAKEKILGENEIEIENIFAAREKAVEDEIRSIPSILRNILFIGNDYISIENIDLDRGMRRTLQVYTIDNLEDLKPIKLSDLIGENGKTIFSEGLRNTVAMDSTISPNEENIGLVRRNGYWTLKGRINYRQNDEELYKDFNINAIPPKEMVSYDEQHLPWDAIKLILPDAGDVYSSPNNDFIIVITSSHMMIYYINDGDISNNPGAIIKLPYDSSVIMSEWSIGRYVNMWQNEVISNGGIKIENNN